MMLFHAFENIGMCIGLMPVTGIPLPFVSYGGSSLIAFMMLHGIIQAASDIGAGELERALEADEDEGESGEDDT